MRYCFCRPYANKTKSAEIIILCDSDYGFAETVRVRYELMLWVMFSGSMNAN